MVVEVPQFPHPLTSILLVGAAHFESISFEMLIHNIMCIFSSKFAHGTRLSHSDESVNYLIIVVKCGVHNMK